MNIKSGLIYIFFCAYGVMNLFHPTIFSGFQNTQSNPGDTLLNNYFLEHAWQLLSNSSYIGRLFSAPFFSPYQNTIAVSENLFASAPIYAALRLFLDAALAFQWWMIIVTSLSFFGFIILMRSLGTQPIWAAFPAFLYAFGMPRLAQIGHQQLLFGFFAPLAFLACCKFILLPRRKLLVAGLFFSFMQLLSGIYTGWFLFLVFPIFLVYYCFFEKQGLSILEYLKACWKSTALMGIIFSASCFSLLRPYVRAKDETLGNRSYADVSQMLPRIESFLHPPYKSLWWNLWGERSGAVLPMAHEHHLFLGLGILFFAGICFGLLLVPMPSKLIRPEISQSLYTSRKTLAFSCLLTVLTVFLLCLYFPNEFSFWKIAYEFLPGASAIRGVTRIWTIAYIPLLVAVFLIIDTLDLGKLQQLGVRHRFVTRFVVSCFTVLLVVEQFSIATSSFKRADYDALVNEGSELISQSCDVAYFHWDVQAEESWGINPPMPRALTQWVQPIYWQIMGMWIGLVANVPIANGYSSGIPKGYENPAEPMDVFKLVTWLGPDTKGRLCILKPRSASESSPAAIALGLRPIAESEHLRLNSISLPVNQIFRQKISVSSEEQEQLQDLATDAIATLYIEVENTGNFPWYPVSAKPTHLSYRWLGSDKVHIDQVEPMRSGLSEPLFPGESEQVLMQLQAPAQSGSYFLELTMVQEEVAWFSDRGAEAAIVGAVVVGDE